VDCTEAPLDERTESSERGVVRRDGVSSERAVATDDDVWTAASGEVRRQTEAKMITGWT
jgi:hypothetical protein